MSSGTPTKSASPKRNAYIVSAWYDWAFFLVPPTLALIVGVLIAGTGFSDEVWEFKGTNVTWSTLLIGIVIHAHLVIVFFRSHGNPKILKTYPLRFLLVPVLLYLAMISSNYVIYACSVVATFWDVYHSGMQTFGFGRIYDAKSGNNLKSGRNLDWALNQLLYAGPIVAGVTMIDHFEDFREFEDIGVYMFSEIPVWMEGNQGYFTWALLSAGAAFLVIYVFEQVRMSRAGQKVSVQKVVLYVSTGACSLYTWGFNSWGEAFFIMNLFHAIQYFGIVWAKESGNLQRLFQVERLGLDKVSLVGSFTAGKLFTLIVFFSVAGLYGLWVQVFDASAHTLWALTLIVALLHFWYDGFIWSVQKNQV